MWRKQSRISNINISREREKKRIVQEKCVNWQGQFNYSLLFQRRCIFGFFRHFEWGKKQFTKLVRAFDSFFTALFFISSRRKKKVKRDGKKSTLNNANQIESWKVNKNKCDSRIGQPIYRDRRDDVHISQ